MNNFFAIINRMKNIERWSLMRSNQRENIMEHSHMVAVLSHALAVIGNTYFNKNYDANKIAMVALFHETSEVITGDLPTPIKYFNPEIKTAYKNLEKIAENKIIATLPSEMQGVYSDIISNHSQDEHRIMKLADKLAAYIKCIEELKLGNMEFKKAHDTIKADLENTNSLELSYFLNNFLESFTLTLDELDM